LIALQDRCYWKIPRYCSFLELKILAFNRKEMCGIGTLFFCNFNGKTNSFRNEFVCLLLLHRRSCARLDHPALGWPNGVEGWHGTVRDSLLLLQKCMPGNGMYFFQHMFHGKYMRLFSPEIRSIYVHTWTWRVQHACFLLPLG
jgi:hypothetical protein